MLLGLILITVMLVMSFAVGIFSPHDPMATDPLLRLNAPTLSHICGTDDVGRDILTRMAMGMRVSLGIAVAVTCASGLVGITVGVMSAYWPSTAKILMRIVDGIMSFPAIILAILLAGILGAGTSNIIIALSISSFPSIARVAKSAATDVLSKEYLESAVILGKSDGYIITRYILPNIASRLIVQITYTFAMAILYESVLSFLGVGIKVPTPSLGGMVSDGRSYISIAPWVITFPGLAISCVVFGLNMVGDGLKDMFDPRRNKRG